MFIFRRSIVNKLKLGFKSYFSKLKSSAFLGVVLSINKKLIESIKLGQNLVFKVDERSV